MRSDERGARRAIVFDSGMPDPHTPAITVGLRGVVQLTLDVRTAARNLHSGLYGGSVLNALHVLHGAARRRCCPGPDGRLREELRDGLSPPGGRRARVLGAPAQRRGGARRRPAAGPSYPGAGAEYYLRNGADASLDVNEIHGGEPRTIVPAQRPARR